MNYMKLTVFMLTFVGGQVSAPYEGKMHVAAREQRNAQRRSPFWVAFAKSVSCAVYTDNVDTVVHSFVSGFGLDP